MDMNDVTSLGLFFFFFLLDQRFIKNLGLLAMDWLQIWGGEFVMELLAFK